MDIIAIATNYIIPLVAIAGLGLSIYNTYCHWREYRPNVSLEFSYQDSTFEPACGEMPYHCYVLVVKNLGNVNVIIDFAGFKWRKREYKEEYYGHSITDEYRSFPYKLVPGSTLSIEFLRKTVKRELLKMGASGTVRISGFIKAGSGKYYSSPTVAIDIK
jgi:hypothetical protein